MKPRYQDINAEAVDKWVAEGWEWGRPIDHDVFVRAANGDWQVLLTPLRSVPREWFGEMRGKRVLGLASGGGQQMPVFAALGAGCTVLDYSPAQLNAERLVAQREGYEIAIVRADMTQPLPFEDASFDIIFHPVSNCYIRDVKSVWRECFRILKKGGRLLSGLDTGLNFLFDEEDETRLVRPLPFDPLVDEELYHLSVASDWGIQFSHTVEEQIGGQIEAGFLLRDIYHDLNGEGKLRELNVPTFFATLAEKP